MAEGGQNKSEAGTGPDGTDHIAPLAGVKVLSLAEQFPGPLCTRLLMDLGADVIQLERPGYGDPLRVSNPWLFRACAIGRKSIALDLKVASELDIARGIVRQMDIFVEGFRPGVIDRLGLGYSSVKDLNPSIVYCSISGYGQSGPYSSIGGHNINYEAVSGLLDPFIDPDSPYRYFPGGAPLGDIIVGCLAVANIVSVLRKAEMLGVGEYIDLSITDSLVFALAPNITRAVNGADAWPAREGAYQVFHCKDGSIAIGIAQEDHFWTPLCQILGLEDFSVLDHDARVDHHDEIQLRIQEVLATKSVSHWLDQLSGEVPCSTVNPIEHVLDDPQIVYRNMCMSAIDEKGNEFSTVRSPLRAAARPEPALLRVANIGESTAEIISSLGLA